MELSRVKSPAAAFWPAALAALVVTAVCALPAGRAVAEPASPTTRPDATALLDPVRLWLNELNDPDPAARAKAARQLGGAARPEAVGPLIELLPVRYEATGRMRVVSDDRPLLPGAPTPGPGPTSQPDADALRNAQLHADQIGSRPFLTELLGHERASSWQWVRRRQGRDPKPQDNPSGTPSPSELAEELDRTTSAEPLPEASQLAVRLVGQDGPAVTELVNLMMAIYQRRTETRYKQRRELLDLLAQLGRAREALAASQSRLDGFARLNNVAEVQRQYEEAARRAGPLIQQRDRLRVEMNKANAAANALQQGLDRAVVLSDRAMHELTNARAQLDYLLGHPTDPRAAWQNRVAQAQRTVRDLEIEWVKRQREIDRLAPAVARAQDAANRAARRVTEVEFQIDRIFGDIDDKYYALQQQIKPLAEEAKRAYEAVEALAAKAAKLPPMSELESAQSYALVVARAGSAEPKSQPLEVRLAAVEALGRLGDPRAVDPLIALLADKDEQLKAAAAVALRRITGQDLGADPAKWSAWQAERNKPIALP